MKKIWKYILTFILIVFITLMLLNLVTKIPNEKVRENINASTDAFRMNARFKIAEYFSKKNYGVRHIYGDAIMANIIWHLDFKDAFKEITF